MELVGQVVNLINRALKQTNQTKCLLKNIQSPTVVQLVN